ADRHGILRAQRERDGWRVGKLVPAQILVESLSVVWRRGRVEARSRAVDEETRIDAERICGETELRHLGAVAAETQVVARQQRYPRGIIAASAVEHVRQELIDDTA